MYGILTPHFLSAAHLVALVVTLLVEGTGMAVLLRVWGSSRAQVQRCVFVCLGLNLLTHTIFWIAYPLVPLEATLRLWGFEILIVIVEGLIYHRVCPLSLPRAMGISLLLNLASFWLGNYLWQLVLMNATRPGAWLFGRSLANRHTYLGDEDLWPKVSLDLGRRSHLKEQLDCFHQV